MARWRPLPAPLDDDTRLLVERLRTLKEQTGLTLVELAAHTAYSKSTWHRYLNGDRFPPRQAVEALGRLAGADASRLLTLWSVARHAASRPQNLVGPPARPAEPEPRHRWRRTAVALAAAFATLGAAALAVRTITASASSVRGAATSCRGEACQGRFAGPSGCTGDARTESAVTTGGYVVRLRYSPSCAAFWAEVYPHGSGGVREVSIKAGPDEHLTAYPKGEANGTSSPMLAPSGGWPGEACAVVADKLACTSEDGAKVTPAPADERPVRGEDLLFSHGKPLRGSSCTDMRACGLSASYASS